MARAGRWSAALLTVALLVAGCSDDKKGGSAENLGGNATPTSVAATSPGAAAECKVEGGSTNTPELEVMVTLSEWLVKPSGPVKAGVVSITAENAGKEKHELVIVKGESAEVLPKDADGALDEDKLPEGALVGEIEPFAAGQVCKGAFSLATGKYVLLCNIVETEESGKKESHLKEGMHTPFVVS